ncbi:hypothetical protein LTR64_004629 [Lithohypha guttulata]|uniref:uncharacterized protein n=1 Tax=Lithohypha guttulata TaxID=1690604 RepID=UPI002DDE0C00|nr:hypothetical protein LTR51_006073 [Lithohypha guttulata]
MASNGVKLMGSSNWSTWYKSDPKYWTAISAWPVSNPPLIEGEDDYKSLLDGDNFAPDPKVAPIPNLLNINLRPIRVELQAAIVYYNIDLLKYEKQVKQIKAARKVLFDSLSSLIQSQAAHLTDPVDLANYLVETYRPVETVVRQDVLRKMRVLTLAGSKYNMEYYLNKFYEARTELAEVGTQMNDSELCDYII